MRLVTALLAACVILFGYLLAGWLIFNDFGLSGAAALLATLILTLSIILILRVPEAREAQEMIVRLRADFDALLAEQALGFNMTTNVVFALRGFRRELYVVGGARDDDHVWRWQLSDVDWLGRRRELMSLASVEQAVAAVLARYLAGESPPFD